MANPLSLVHNFARALRGGPDPPPKGTLGQLVQRVRDVDDAEDDWVGLVVDLGDGRTVGEVVDALYRHELRAGAWIADIGMWRHLFVRSTVDLILRMSREGYIRLEPGP